MATILNIFKDTRVMFVVIFIIMFAGSLYPIPLPLTADPVVRGAYNAIEAVNPGDVVLVAFDMISGNERGDSPGADIAIQHLKQREANIIIFNWSAEALFYQDREHIGWNWKDADGNPAATSKDAVEYGTKLIDLGFLPGARAATLYQLAANIRAFNAGRDRYGTNLDNLPMMKNVNSAKNISLVVCLGCAGKPEPDLIAAFNPHGVPVVTFNEAEGVTMVIFYYNAGLLKGIVSGVASARSYETLVTAKYGSGVPIWAARLNTGEFFIGIIIILGVLWTNIKDLVLKKKNGGT